MHFQVYVFRVTCGMKLYCNRWIDVTTFVLGEIPYGAGDVGVRQWASLEHEYIIIAFLG